MNFFGPWAVYGNLPSESQLSDWEFAVSQHSAVPQGVLVSSYSFVPCELGLFSDED